MLCRGCGRTLQWEEGAYCQSCMAEAQEKIRRQVVVYCPKCGWINETETEFLNVEEGLQGEDRLTFKCKCGDVCTSVRRG